MINKILLSASILSLSVIFGAGCNQDPITNFDPSAQIDQIGDMPSGITNSNLETLTDSSGLPILE